MIQNLTPHVVTIVLPDGSTIALLPDPAGPARIAVRSEPDGDIEHDAACPGCRPGPAAAPSSDPRAITEMSARARALGGECPFCGGGEKEGTFPIVIPVFRTTLGDPTGLPEPQTGVTLLVSAVVRGACPGRIDLVSPGELVRGPDGQPVGCKGLAR